jgi:hypothetical protein
MPDLPTDPQSALILGIGAILAVLARALPGILERIGKARADDAATLRSATESTRAALESEIEARKAAELRAETSERRAEASDRRADAAERRAAALALDLQRGRLATGEAHRSVRQPHEKE